jgi:DNA (cytosine-5)-methyltransferase 1
MADWQLLQASDFGVPQLRPRFVLVAMQPEDFAFFRWPDEYKKAPPTVGEALYDLMRENGWSRANEWRERANGIAPTVVGGSKKHGGADLGPTRAKRAWQEMWVDAHGIADRAPRTDADITERGPKLTCEMVKRLQGWDDTEFKWNFTGRKTSTYRQIGNAFPPPVARAVGSAIAAALLPEKFGMQRHEIDLKENADRIYRALKKADGFLTADQIGKEAELTLELHELERRISLLGRDFDIEVKNDGSSVAYRLGKFKAFLGQDDHARHEQFLKNRAQIS